jgi:hypothetical protein
VFAAPPPVVVPETAPEIGRPELGLPEDRYVFLFCLDLLSVVERKNPVGAIEAFKQAFSPGEGPVLVVKTTNGNSREMDLEMVRYAASGRPDVVVMDGDFPRPRLGSLMDAADCYVSLHRSEGFGLTMAESMALGKPVIATAYSGNLEFMTDENSFLVPFSWTRVPEGAGPYPAGTRWAEPDIGAAAAMMRTVVESPEIAAPVAERGRDEVRRHHGLETRARFVKSRFEAIGHGQKSVSQRGNGRRKGALSAVQIVAAGTGVAVAKVSGHGGSKSPGPPDPALYRRVMGRVVGHGGEEEGLRKSVDALAQQVQELRGVCHAAHAKQSELDAQRERAIRDIGHRLDSIERRIDSLEQRCDEIAPTSEAR